MTTESINLYIQEKFDSATIKCAYTQQKGRLLFTSEAIPSGSVLFTERILHYVVTDNSHPIHKLLEECCQMDEFDYEVMWYWCAVNSLLSEEERKHLEKVQAELRVNGVTESSARKSKTKSVDATSVALLRTFIDAFLEVSFPCVSEHVRSALLLFYRQELSSPSEQAVILERKLKELYGFDDKYVPASVVKATSDGTFEDDDYLEAWRILYSTFRAAKIDDILKIWILNCFEAEWDPLAYCTYFLPTFCSHSCLPNTLWHIDDSGDFVLVARRSLKAGEEISLSYLSDDDLLTPTHNRRRDLSDTKQFLCTCPRCEAPADLSRGFSCTKCEKGVWFAKTCEEGSDCHPVDRLGSGVASFDKLMDHIDGVSEAISQYPTTYSYIDVASNRIRDEDLATESISNYLNTFTPYKCCACGALAADDDVKELLNYEASLWKLNDLPTDSFDALPSFQCQWGSRLTQHRYIIHLCDTLLTWTIPIAYRNRLLKVKLNIAQKVFPAPSGVCAWTLRDLVVLNLNMNSFQLKDPDCSWSGAEASMESIENILVGEESQIVERTALMLRMFRVLFTKDYDFFTDTHNMMLSLVEELKACLLKLSVHSTVPASVTERLKSLENLLELMVQDSC